MPWITVLTCSLLLPLLLLGVTLLRLTRPMLTSWLGALTLSPTRLSRPALLVTSCLLVLTVLEGAVVWVQAKVSTLCFLWVGWCWLLCGRW